jgi:hypothetical protein
MLDKLTALQALVSVDASFGFSSCGDCNQCIEGIKDGLTKLSATFLDLRQVYFIKPAREIDIWVFSDTWQLGKREHYLWSLHPTGDAETMLWDAELPQWPRLRDQAYGSNFTW